MNRRRADARPWGTARNIRRIYITPLCGTSGAGRFDRSVLSNRLSSPIETHAIEICDRFGKEMLAVPAKVIRNSSR
jgi:hypothetical protein